MLVNYVRVQSWLARELLGMRLGRFWVSRGDIGSMQGA
jgi:hypothetical protein